MSRGEQPARIRWPANAGPGEVHRRNLGWGRRLNLRVAPPKNLPRQFRPPPTLEGWYPRKYAYCTIYRK